MEVKEFEQQGEDEDEDDDEDDEDKEDILPADDIY